MTDKRKIEKAVEAVANGHFNMHDWDVISNAALGFAAAEARLKHAEAIIAGVAARCIEDEGDFEQFAGIDTLRASRRTVTNICRDYFGGIGQRKAREIMVNADWYAVFEHNEAAAEALKDKGGEG